MDDQIIRRWLGSRVDIWRDLRSLTDSHEKKRHQSLADSERLIRQYQNVQSDLSLAKTELDDPQLGAQLEAMLLKANKEISKPVSFFWDDLKQLFGVRTPRILWAAMPNLASVTVIFLLSAFASAWLINTFGELSELFLSPGMVDSVQGGKLWTEHIFSVTPASVASIGILTNNIVVSFTALVMGALYGLGTIYITVLNGALLGGVFAYTAKYQLDGKLWDFVVAHGCVEITIILIATAMGLGLGQSIARPGDETRANSFNKAAADGLLIVFVCVPFLIIAGFIEGYVSPSSIPTSAKVAIGVFYWLIFTGIMTGGFFRRRGGAA